MLRGLVKYCVLAITATAILTNCVRKKPANQSITSPENTYTIHLEEQVDGPTAKVPYEHIVWFTVHRNGEAVITKHDLDGDESYDKRLWAKYINYTWKSENILRFGDIDSPPRQSNCEIKVRNEASSDITCLQIGNGTDESFLLFDIKPGQESVLQSTPAPYSDGQESRIYVKAHFNNERVAPAEDIVFYKNKSVQNMHYCVIIKNDRIEVGSRELERKNKAEPNLGCT